MTVTDTCPTRRDETVSDAFSALRQRSSADRQFETTKLLYHTKSILQWLQGGLRVPVTLELDPTLVCNDRCPRCVHAFAHSHRFLSLAQVHRILDEAASLGVRGLTLSGGGEPLCHPNIHQLLTAIQRAPFSAGLITNGGLIRGPALANAIVHAFDWVRVSLDAATEPQFRSVRGIRGLDRRIEALRQLEAARRAAGSRCELGVSFLTSADVKADILPAVAIVRDLGFDYIQFKPKISWSEDQHHRSQGLPQSGVFDEVIKSLAYESSSFRVLVSGKKYASEAMCQDVNYSAFHSAYFIASVGPNVRGSEVRPTLYLDCSAKYLPRWTIGEFDSLETILHSPARTTMLDQTPSSRYCIPAEKHSAYNTLLQDLLHLNTQHSLSSDQLADLVPASVRHPYSL
jgi:MoaA/NifB/PqqE/SkfB family radical SAM enzyme